MHFYFFSLEQDIVYAVDFNHKKERHLGGCELEKLSRPSLLITDAFNSSYRQERRRLRDEKFVAQLQDTCRTGGSVLVATDTAGRVLEMTHMLEQMWSTKESGLSAYTLAILSNTGYHAIHFAKQMIEWMSDKLIKAFDVQRNNPFSFKHVKFCHNINDLNRLPSPKVVLSSFPDLECGYARELFIQWATNPKNTIVLTCRTGPGTLARVLIDNPEIQTFRLVEKKRVKLEGDELDQYMKMKLKEHKARIKEELMIDDSDESDDDDEINILEPGQHDIVLLQEKPGTQGLFRSKKHHPMYPFQEEKIIFIFINLELEEPPTKCISQTVTVRVAAQVVFIDFEGRSDGESVLKIMEAVHPTRIILVRGVRNDMQAFAQNLRSITKAKVFTPKLGEIIDASLETHIYQTPYHEPVFINEMRLSDFKQILSRAGIEAEFNSGILWCGNGTIALRRQDTGTLAIEGCLSEEYFEIRDLLYSQYAVL
ncbi:putative cleavage and polyadenylation specificity factor subunit 2 [Armadillidium nasatum]|uniref:Cleavage and polyadenylation specificity factor subunit 2 n=1 Tax=Armadillidium nasatum TaxID=96803 RepID=A0A5N5SM34_9CRUS|nr:putative cleavage and polyadenylation specificity factor subunit 2 [Armadillidium nasatum]